MTDPMQAVVVHGPEDCRLERVPVPDPAPGELLVKVEAVGICASDLKCYHGAVKYWGDETRPATTDRNVIPGHEFVGTVAHVDDFGRQHFGVDIGDGSSPNRSCPAGNAGSACAANTGCVPHTTSTASTALLMAPWPNT
jgi:erythritol/L-threitol dehydrogenase